jgi:hypothetical protein
MEEYPYNEEDKVANNAKLAEVPYKFLALDT